MLEDLVEEGQDQVQEGQVNGSPLRSTGEALPRIRTNQHQKQVVERQFSFANSQHANVQTNKQQRYIPPHRGGVTFRGGTSRQAAAETEHTVVRGFNKGKKVVSSVVGNEAAQPEGPHFVPDNSLMGDPPDDPMSYARRGDPPDDAMEGVEDDPGRGDPEAEGPLRH
nr:uncharacterized protein LOC109192823 [Ipomoea trifida]